MKIRVHGTVLYIIRNRSIVFSINSKWVARLFKRRVTSEC